MANKNRLVERLKEVRRQSEHARKLLEEAAQVLDLVEEDEMRGMRTEVLIKKLIDFFQEKDLASETVAELYADACIMAI